MRHGANIAVLATGTLLTLLLGCTTPSAVRRSTAAPLGPWTGASQLLGDVEKDVAKDDVPGVRDHSKAIEDALAEGAKTFPPPPMADGVIPLLTDGDAETRAVLAAARAPKAVAVENPYPRLAVYLGTYYNNTGRPVDALRVLGLGFKLSASGSNLGEQLPNLYGETGFSLEILKHWAEGLQVCRTGLGLPAVTRLDRARLYRCSGYCLSELGRYEEAETAYRAAILADPSDKMAPVELEFVQRNRAKTR